MGEELKPIKEDNITEKTGKVKKKKGILNKKTENGL